MLLSPRLGFQDRHCLAGTLLIALIGLLMYAFCVNPKLQEVGRIAYAMGLLAFLLQGVQHVVALLR